MPSPFPGMDPYIEGPAVWPDFHDSFIAYLREALNAALPAPYFASIRNRIWIEDSERRVEPDVDILHPPGWRNGSGGHSTDGGLAVADDVQTRPVFVDAPREVAKEWFAEIRTASGTERLVTTIEVLSPTNKTVGSIGRRKYRKKQKELLDSSTNLVEIDFLRAGTHSTAVPLDVARRKTGEFDYHVCVHRYANPAGYEVYPILLPETLPAIAIPLLEDHPDLKLSLQPLVDRCYETGQYARRVRYESEPPGPLTDDQRVWVAGRLTSSIA